MHCVLTGVVGPAAAAWVENGTIVYLPFGQARGHRDESNAVQLWSTVYLAVKPP